MTTLEQRLQDIVQRLAPMRPVKITLFGSAARGTADEYSDIDLVVIAEGATRRFLDRIADAYDLIDPRFALDILIYTPQEYEAMLEAENPLIQRVQEEGRVIYERSAA